MATDLISKKTRYEFREYFVSRTLREIEAAFDAADVPIDSSYEPPVGGQRRSLVEQYYQGVVWSKWSHVRRILRVYENVLSELETGSASGGPWAENDAKAFTNLRKWVEKDGFIYANGTLSPKAKIEPLADIEDATAALDLPELRRQVDRMRAAVDDDPALAIGTAKELLETTCKTILRARGGPAPADSDVAALVKETRKALKLMPDDVPDTAKGAEAIRRVLGSLGAVAQGMAELRNLYGTGHGREGKRAGPRPRHARLAVGAAAAVATFLLETHEERD